eukprot:2495983-Prorocentrum_lima.AAC.1
MGVGHVQSGKEGGGGARRVVRGATIRTKAGNVKDSHCSRASSIGNTVCSSIVVRRDNVFA